VRALTVFPETAFTLGPVRVTDTVVNTWIVMAAIVLAAFVATRRLAVRPGRLQGLLESLYSAIEETVLELLPVDTRFVVPVLGTLWLFIGAANLAGLVPGMKTPTADLNTTFALALVSYALTHVVGIKAQGLRGYLAHYAQPTWLLLPFHLIAEATRTVALAVRLFGNMLSGDMVAVIILGIAGLLVPIPFELLHIVIGLIQAYIFGMLTLVFIAGGIGAHPEKPSHPAQGA
jgi:F-type H+-transporting ATPase subunit a